MDRYVKVDAPSPSLPADADEVRVTTGGKIRDYVEFSLARLSVRARHPLSRALNDKNNRIRPHPRLDTDSAFPSIGNPQDANGGRITLVGVGKAITKAVTVAEILKHRVAGLHQHTEFHTLAMDESFEPKEQGLNTVHRRRHVSAVTVTLCNDISRMDTAAVGYAEPVPEDSVRAPLTKAELKKVGLREVSGRGTRRRVRNGYDRSGGNNSAGTCADATGRNTWRRRLPSRDECEHSKIRPLAVAIRNDT
jgi:ribonuclease P/MRP protein subunit RPP25